MVHKKFGEKTKIYIYTFIHIYMYTKYTLLLLLLFLYPNYTFFFDRHRFVSHTHFQEASAQCDQKWRENNRYPSPGFITPSPETMAGEKQTNNMRR